MKKSLLLCGSLLCGAASALAAGPQVLPGQAVSYISPDARYVVSEFYGNMTITDLTTPDDVPWTYAAGQDAEFSGGAGRCWSDNGIFVGSIDNNGTASIWRDGFWEEIPSLQGKQTFLMGINAPGNVICGFIGTGSDGDKEAGYTPYIWKADEKGVWGEPEPLPYPEKDFTNRAPQGVTALSVSPDGRTVVGQIVDFTGWLISGIVYHKADDGTWSYQELGADLVNPDHIVFPEYPGDYPKAPDPVAYLSAEQYQNYYAAVQSAQGAYVDPADYLAGEEKEKYDAAMAEYKTVLDEYLPKQQAFYDALDQVNAKAAEIVYNLVKSVPDCSHVIYTSQKTVYIDPLDRSKGTQTIYTIYDFDTATGAYTVVPQNEADPVLVSDIAADGTMLGMSNGEVKQTYVLAPGAKEWATLQDYVAQKYQPTYDWMKENMVHTYYTEDPDDDTAVEVADAFITGTAVCTPDLKTIATWVQRVWDDGTDAVYSYLLPTSEDSSVRGIESADSAPSAPRYYNLQGVSIPAPVKGEPCIRLTGTTAEKIIR